MKCKKLSFIKRIFVLFCTTLLLTTNIFLSYSTAVHASDDYDIIDALEDICAVILVVGGALSIPASGGLTSLGYVSLLSGILGLRDNFSNLYDYVTDNGDGTYTINEQFIQAALQAAEELEARGFTDSDITRQKNGSYNLRYAVVVNDDICFNCNQHVSIKYEGLIFMNGLSCCKVEPGSLKQYSLTVHYAGNSTHLVDYQRAKYSCGFIYNTITASGDSYGANVPIFTDSEDVRNYLSTGTGYKNALNYRTAPLFRKHSSYTPTYSGGAVTVNRTVIENITNKITEVDADDSLSDDQKIDILRQYIFSGGKPTPTPTPNPPDPDYDDNKDLPAGEDLTDTNSWLKKIYLKVCQIYVSMSASAGQSMSEVVESIENMKQMLEKYLKEITGDLDDIKGQLEEMTEEEFSDKSGSFLDETAESFSEIGEIAKKKFPLSIPYDLYNLLAVISPKPSEQRTESLYETEQAVYNIQALPVYEGNGKLMSIREGSGNGSLGMSETGAPVFNLPIVVTSVGWDYTVTVDMTQFQTVADLSRTMFTLIFILGIIKLSISVIGLWGDIID